jgi:hypothetical protein
LGTGKVYITNRTKGDTTTVEIGLGIRVVPSLTLSNEPIFAMFRSKFVENVTMSGYILGSAEVQSIFFMQIYVNILN